MSTLTFTLPLSLALHPRRRRKLVHHPVVHAPAPSLPSPSWGDASPYARCIASVRR